VLGLDTVRADEALADEMQVAVRTRLFHSQVLHFENDEPVQLEERWVNPAVAPDYAEDFTNTTPNQYLMRALLRVEYRIEAAAPGAERASSCGWTTSSRVWFYIGARGRRAWSHRSRICGIPAAVIASPGISDSH
jgi:DNA-binding GntR family transcriptional regulator